MNDNDAPVLRDLGDGLIMRPAVPADAEALLALQTEVFLGPNDQPDPALQDWSRDLCSNTHPTFRIGDFIVVEDTRAGQLVSSLNLISQRWTYGGIEFGVGRPELVCTRREFRNRGLVRAQFELMHAWCAERGHLVSAITGIPQYYRQFGYEMTVNLGGSRSGPRHVAPALKEGQQEPFTIREAGEADLDFVAALYAQWCRRSLLACQRDAAMWRYELMGQRRGSMERRVFCVIETPDGRRVGLLSHNARNERGAQGVSLCELLPDASYLAVAPSVLRYIVAQGDRLAAAAGGGELKTLWFMIGACPPLETYLAGLLSHYRKPYAWYLRVFDMPAFLRQIAPVLEDRLAASPAPGHTGELRLSFYRSGVRLAFEAGKVTAVEAWTPSPERGGDAAFPNLTFLQLLFGYRTLEEIQYASPDCWVGSDAVPVLLNALFPKQASAILPIS